MDERAPNRKNIAVAEIILLQGTEAVKKQRIGSSAFCFVPEKGRKFMLIPVFYR